MHCISCSHCMSNRILLLWKTLHWPDVGTAATLSPGALQLCTTSSTAQCDHAHAVHIALREFAESCGKFAEIVRKIAGFSAPAKGAESGGKWRKVAEIRGKWRKFAEMGGKRSHNNLLFGMHMAVCTDTPCSCTNGFSLLSKAVLYLRSATLQVVL